MRISRSGMAEASVHIDPQAMYDAAQYYRKPHFTSDTNKSHYWLEKAGHYGHADAQFELAGKYYKGSKEITKDLHRALFWAAKAAAKRKSQKSPVHCESIAD